ncbi:DUF309 domain-containing protein [Myxococcota bacterium]|nr:DUF309 domain-containing protein [Myxococcota bacterium]
MAEGHSLHQDEVRAGLALLRARAWFEAHEALEGPWRRATGADKAWLHALIHGAVALEHLRRGNPRGAWGQWCKCQARLRALPPGHGPVDLAPWGAALERWTRAIRLEERSRRHVAGEPDVDLPPLPPEQGWPLP